MKTTTYACLAVMMFGQYFIWGVWYVTLGTYLTKIGFQGTDIGWAYSMIALAAVLSAFFVSLVADKYFAAEKLTAILHLGGGGLMYLASTLKTPGPFLWVLLAYSLFYAPTLALTSTIGIRHCTEPSREFPKVRVMGTFGWIVAGLTISFLGFEFGPEPMQLAALFSILLGAYSFTLPNTPPQSTNQTFTAKEILGLDSLQLVLRDRSLAVLCVSALLMTLPFAMYHPVTNMYLNELGVSNVAGKMTLAQMSEVIFMLLIPFFFVRLGMKKMLLIGMIAWVVRFAFFALGNNGPGLAFLYAGILLHGVCYDFFYVTAQIYMDKKAPPALRASMQGFFTLLTWGLGWLLGSLLNGQVLQTYQVADAAGQVTGHHWNSILLVPGSIAFVVAVFFALFFKDEPAANSRA